METLIQQIRDKFTSLGWHKELENNDMWVNEQEVMMNIGTIIINGQQQPHSENDHGIWSHHFMGNRCGNSRNSVRLYF